MRNRIQHVQSEKPSVSNVYFYLFDGLPHTFNSIKKAEIEAIKDNEATINQLKIDKLKAEFENEVSKLNNNIVSLEKDIELKESELKSLNNVISSKDLEIKTLIKENKQSKKTSNK